MKIAIVGPSPVPFTIGGIENLMWGLCDAINQQTEHQCELIKLPSRELNFWDLIETYYSFYSLDVSHFDMVIYTKYPGWMVRHPKGICYMAHCLRGLYDTYHLMNLPTEVAEGNKDVDRILRYMDECYCPEDLDEFFGMLFDLKNRTIPNEYYAFPGPFIRKIIMYLDRWGLSQSKTVGYYSISDTVRKRTEYFPAYQDVQVVYPPSTLKQCSCGDYQYVFMVSRLDAPKRIDMLIRAMKYVKSDVKLLIAGRGPEREKLEKLAGNDSRIQFLGFVNDDEVETYYANSLVIPYFPYDEDYGYITVESMLHKKAVITTKDAGGPTEFVRDGETGFVVDFEEHAIAEKIDYFAEHPDEAKRMGENAYNVVKDITWNSVVEQLNQCINGEEVTKKRKKIVVTSSFGITPPQGGGQARIFNVYKNVAKEYDVEIVSFTGYGNPGLSAYIEAGMKETRIPMSKEHFEAEMDMQKRVGSVPISDISMIVNAEKTEEYDIALKNALKDCDMAIISHPYVYFEAKKHLQGIPFVYEAHNVEYNMKKAVLPDNAVGKELLTLVYDVEKECCTDSAFIMTCSEEDREKLSEMYGVSKDKIIVVPNGVDASKTGFTSIEQRQQNKKKAGVTNEKIGLFMGSWHGPNLEACEKIFDIAKQCPDEVFLLMGSQCSYFLQKRDQYDIPANVGLLGLVSEDEKLKVFNTVDFALNPMLSGSGTNLKMFDYMSGGIPVITTSFGTRGIQDTSGLIIAEVDEMPEAIRKFKLSEQSTTIQSARRTVEEEFDWKVIVRPLMERLKKM